MRNERGITLVALMAAIAISGLILGVATLLLGSVLQLSKNSQQSFADQESIKRTTTILTNQLNEANIVVAYTHGSDRELRYSYGSGLKSLYFDRANRRLTLYDFSNDANTNNDEAHFISQAIDPAADAGLYSNPIILSDIVSDAKFEQSNQTPIPSTPITQASLSHMIYLTFTFDFNKILVSGRSQQHPETTTIAVKLLADWTPK